VTVLPSGISFDLQPGETILQAAWKAGYEWPTLCYGRGTCTACQCEVLDGVHLLSPRTEAESVMLGDLSRRVRRADPRRTRLACQVTATGNVTVRKPGVRVPDPAAATTTPRTSDESSS
jgi:2Fe-2S ferredoxin